MTLQSPTGTLVSLRGVTYCGRHYCDGCDHPAAYATIDGRRRFLCGSAAACGPVLQPADQHRDGVQVDLATVLTAEEVADLARLWWT